MYFFPLFDCHDKQKQITIYEWCYICSLCCGALGMSFFVQGVVLSNIRLICLSYSLPNSAFLVWKSGLNHYSLKTNFNSVYVCLISQNESVDIHITNITFVIIVKLNIMFCCLCNLRNCLFVFIFAWLVDCVLNLALHWLWFKSCV